MAKILILIVEDDFGLAHMYAEKLKVDGFEVEIAHDGKEGLRKLRDDHPILVLMDLMLPNLDGLEVLKKAKADPLTWDIPIIILTNLSSQDDTKKAVKEGAAGYIVKSEQSPEEVVGKIRAIISQHKPPEPAK